MGGLQTSQKMQNQTQASKTLMQKLNINIAEGQAHWMKYRTWSYNNSTNL